jgi:hypothetical protein
MVCIVSPKVHFKIASMGEVDRGKCGVANILVWIDSLGSNKMKKKSPPHKGEGFSFLVSTPLHLINFIQWKTHLKRPFSYPQSL